MSGVTRTTEDRLRAHFRERGILQIDLTPKAAIAVSRSGDRVRVVRFVSPRETQTLDLTAAEALRLAARLVALLAGR